MTMYTNWRVLAHYFREAFTRHSGLRLWGVLVSCSKGQVEGTGLAYRLWAGLVREYNRAREGTRQSAILSRD